jgi:CRISPR-associated protein Cmr2
MRFLVVIETLMDKSYLFASPWLREIRGASVLLDLINRRETKKMPKELGITAYERVYSGGGSGRFLFANEQDAESFMLAVRERYREKTVNARVAVRMLERKAAQSFLEWVSEGVRLARHAEERRPAGAAAPTGQRLRPCSACGSQPAEFTFVEHRDHRLCPACRVKRNEADKLISKVKPGRKRYQPLESAHNLARQRSNKFIFTNLAQNNEQEGYSVYLPRDFETIGAASRPSNTMGFIHAKGNRLGEVERNLGSICKNDHEAEKATRALSEITDKATREAAVEAVMECVDIRTEHDRDRLIPAEFIVACGGELMLAVPAHNAVDVAIHFLRAFRQKTEELQQHYIEKNELQGWFAPKGLTTSAGIVLSQVHYPARDLMALAGALLKSAQARSAELAQQLARGESDDEATGALDFMVFSQAASESVKEGHRKAAKATPAAPETVILTERPYTPTEAERLLQTIRALKAERVPRSRLKALHAAVFHGPVQAQREALAIQERLKAAGSLAEGSALGKLLAGLTRLPFREHRDGTWSTPLTEIFELYDFIQPGK